MTPRLDSARVAAAALPRWTGRLAIAAPLIMWTEFLAVALTRPHYDLLTRAASDLASRGAPNAGVFTVGFFYGGGILTTLIGLGLQAVARGRTWRVGAGLVSVAGVLLIATGAFPNAGAGPQSAWFHGFFSQICFAFIAVAPVVLVIGAPRKLLPGWLRRAWLGSAIAALVIEVSDVVLRHYIRIPDGIFQRPFLMALTVWFVATGVWLIGHRPPQTLE